ncbi:MAG: hypothetical protein LIP09_08600 [Bacteroidales bacterium]|nr:hypothetical protein [Bacteroidales bacterium]
MFNFTLKKLQSLMALMLCFTLCVGFTACGGDDDEDEPSNTPVVTTGKKLMKIAYTYDGMGGSRTWDFTYDSQGNVESYVKTWEDGDKDEGTLYWSEGNIEVVVSSYYPGFNHTDEYTLSNGKVTSASYDEEGLSLSFTYSDEHLTKIIQKAESDKSTIHLTWDGDKITKINEDYSTLTLFYDDTVCKGYNPLPVEGERYSNEVFGDYMIWGYAQPNVFGITRTALPSKGEWSDGDTVKYSYTFTSDGYLQKAVITMTYSSGSTGTTTLTYTWQ